MHNTYIESPITYCSAKFGYDTKNEEEEKEKEEEEKKRGKRI